MDFREYIDIGEPIISLNEFIVESIFSISKRFKKFIETREKQISSILLNEHWIDNLLYYDKDIIKKAMVELDYFQESFIDKLHTKSVEIKNKNLRTMDNKEFIEWLDTFLYNYYEVLYDTMLSYTRQKSFKEGYLGDYIPIERLKEMAYEFDKFVYSIRSILNEDAKLKESILIKNGKYIKQLKTLNFVGKDITRIKTKDYSLVHMNDKLIEPIIESAGVEQQIYKKYSVINNIKAHK